MQWQIDSLPTAASTNDVARERVLAAWQRNEPAEGIVITAARQTAGRGQHGRRWESPPGGLYLSAVVEDVPLEFRGKLALVAGVATAEALDLPSTFFPMSDEAAIPNHTGVQLRWPNDLLLNGKKVCGILTEMNAEPTQVRYVVLGVGINVNHASFAGELEPIATSLRMESGHEWSRVELAAALLKSLDGEYRKLLKGGAEGRSAILREFEARSSFARSRYVRVGEEDAYEGVTEGLDPRGFLLVRTESGLRTVLSGDVRAVDGK